MRETHVAKEIQEARGLRINKGVRTRHCDNGAHQLRSNAIAAHTGSTRLRVDAGHVRELATKKPPKRGQGANEVPRRGGRGQDRDGKPLATLQGQTDDCVRERGKKRNGSAYGEDYEALVELQKLCAERAGVF
jgi:hypothetical protein